MAQAGHSVNLFFQDTNGQPQVIKVMPSSSGKPLTSAGVKAIVKEVTGQDATRIDRQSVGMRTVQKIVGIPQNTRIVTLTRQIDNKQGIRVINSMHHEQSSPSASSSSTVTTPKFLQKNSIPSSSTSGSTATQNQSIINKKLVSSSSTSTPNTTVQNSVSRRRKSDKVGKGLRHFSMKVCEKVKEKGTTTYNEVADELVNEEIESGRSDPIDPANYDQKNIRRRVYDALNVLMAMNIISKEKKEIRWIGLPTNSAQQCTTLEKENQKRRERIEAKQQELRDLILLQVSFKSLVTRNKQAEERGQIPTPNSAIQLPFIVVNTHKETHINCSISHDKTEYFFKFDDKFEIHDHVKVLNRMGLLLGLDKGECTYEDIERAKTMVPAPFQKYIEMYGRGQEDALSDDWEMSNDDNVVQAHYTITTKTELSDSADMEDDDDPLSDQSDVD